MLRRGVRKDRRRDRGSLPCVPIRSDGASEAGRASQSAVGRFTRRTPSFHCSGGDAGENWNRCESSGGGSAYGARIRIRDQQNPVHREAVQGPFKEARVDEERANNQGLTQEHVDHLTSSPYRARQYGTAVTITLGLKRSATWISSAHWLWRRFCHHWAGMISGRITSGTAPRAAPPRRDQRPDRSAPCPAAQWHSSAVPNRIVRPDSWNGTRVTTGAFDRPPPGVRFHLGRRYCRMPSPSSSRMMRCSSLATFNRPLRRWGGSLSCSRPAVPCPPSRHRT